MACGEQCFKGTLHEGEPTGTFKILDNVKVYVASPKAAPPKEAILIYPDVFGVALRNTQLLADNMAIQVDAPTYMIDYFRGDHRAEPGLEPPGFERGKWLASHSPEKVLPIIEKVIRELKQQGVTHFGAVGYCFGGKYVFLTAQSNWIKVGVVCHPSLLEIPGDLNKLSETSKAPLLVNSCEHDPQYPAESQRIGDEILGDGKYKPGYKRNYYPGATHGFGCRADLSNPKDKHASEDSFKETVAWFKMHL